MNPFIYLGLSIPTRSAYRKETLRSKSNNHDKFISFACSYFLISVEDVKGQSRLKEITEVRKIVCYYLYYRFYFSLNHIGKILGNRDHSTILSSIRSFKNIYETDREFREKINQFEREI